MVDAKHDLHMSGGILRCNGYSILCADGGRLIQDRVTDLVFDVLDLFNGFFLSQAIQEQIDV